MANRKSRPTKGRDVGELPYKEPEDYEQQRPLFCMEHINPDFNVKHASMSKDGKAAFADKLESLASITWEQIKRAGRHGLGTELIPVDQLNLTMPRAFEDVTKVQVFRYHGKLPMAGVRVNRTFHIIALEREFGELYKH